jgi:hypothetical protein
VARVAKPRQSDAARSQTRSELENVMYIDRLVEGGEGARAVGGELICLITRPHWFMVAREGVRGLLLMGCGIVLLLFREPLVRQLKMLVPQLPAPRDSSGPAPVPITLSDFRLSLDAALAALSWSGLAFLLMGVLLLGRALLNRHFTEFAITMSTTPLGFGGRIIKVHGILSRQTVTVPLGKVNDLVVYEPLLGRVLGWGDLDIETGNDYTGDRLEYLPNPRGFQDIWKTLIDNGYGDY